MNIPFQHVFRIAAMCALVCVQTANAKAGGDGDNRKSFEKAQAYLSDENYQKALPLLEQILETDPENANVHYLVGICYLESQSNKSLAIPHFRYAINHTTSSYKEEYFKETKAPDDAMYHLARAFHLSNQIDSALYYFEKFNTIVADDKLDIKKQVAKKIEECNTAKELMANPVNITITSLGINVNSPFPEYAPVLSADESTLIFTSRRDNSTGGELTPSGEYFEDILISFKENGEWSKPLSIGSNINTPGHEATIGLSVDGQQLFIYKDDMGDGNIYVSHLEGDVWTTPEKLGFTINSPYQESHAVLSADGNTLYFTSNRPGGFGGKDIYRAKKLPTGDWSLATNLGATINTPYDEEGPFIHPDGVTLYFSSQGHKTMGGFDVFSSVHDEEEDTWSEPVNIGYPINTTDDDVFYTTSPDGKRAYYSSANKNSGLGEKDLYLISLATTEEKQLTVVKGLVKTTYGTVPSDGQIVLTDVETNEVVGIYKPNSKTGKFLLILPAGTNYDLSFEAQGFMFHSQNLDIPEGSAYNEINTAITLEPIIVGEKIVLNNIFFEYNSDKLTQESKLELDKLYRLLDINENLAVGILGHTDSKGSESYNMKLSQARAESVMNYVIGKGIAKERMTAKGFGESQPIARNENPDGSDNPEGRALNRRIELKVLSTEGEVDVIDQIEVPDKLKPEKK
ncbi:MAG: PD40 domain-containing protein [Flavobacteriales bacterium]|nr:PD40 domain-containing protein [Flavobacteriales bacterium]MCB9447638.1 PD40 domain-containing protein [Flavobacteriales bacterium]